jgi:hypothetical protein
VLSSGSVVGADRAPELFDAAYEDHANRMARILQSEGRDAAVT